MNNSRAHTNSLTPIHTSALNLVEVKAAELFLFQQMQSLSFEHEVKSLQSGMSGLEQEQIDITQQVTQNYPFEVTGMDYAGPLTLKKGHTRRPVYIKAYLAIFVCFSTKAVHIEVVEDLTTEDFLAALRRFISRRGLPSQLHSDNGSNFGGAKNDLNLLYKILRENQSSLSTYLLSQRIQWSCIPDHFGGLWEGAVKAAKFYLKRIAGPIKFSISELNTVMCQIKAILNSRPLCSINCHASDGIQSLTPAHFLIGRPITAYPETTIDTTHTLLRRWTMCQAIIHHFWERLSHEYLHQLQKLSKWKLPTDNLRVNDIVFIRENSAFTCHWPIAMVDQVYPGRDNLVRVVRLKVPSTSRTDSTKLQLINAKTSFTFLKRPVTKVALLHREEDPAERSSECSRSAGGGGGVCLRLNTDRKRHLNRCSHAATFMLTLLLDSKPIMNLI